ncbi:MAG: MFS transporter [Pseudomonadota bacterium]
MTETTRRGALVRTSVTYAAMFAAMGAFLPFWPIWLEEWGLTPGEIGLYTSLGMAARVATGFTVPVLADVFDSRRKVMAGAAALAALFFALHALVGSRALLLPLTLAAGGALAAMAPLGEALGAAAATRHGFIYAHARAMGSAGFLASSMLLGVLIVMLGADAVLWYLVGFLLLTALLAEGHPGGGGPRGTPPRLRDVGHLLRDPTFALFTLAASLTQASHAVYYTYGSVHWRALGVPEPQIGMLWAWGVAVEIVLMMTLGALVVARLGAVGTMAIGAAAAVVRWSVMMFDPLGPMLWLVQASHALTFGASYLGAIAFLTLAVPERFSGTAQGAFAGLGWGLMQAGVMALSAALYPLVGGATYALGAGTAALALALTFWLRVRWDGGMLDGLGTGRAPAAAPS